MEMERLEGIAPLAAACARVPRSFRSALRHRLPLSRDDDKLPPSAVKKIAARKILRSWQRIIHCIVFPELFGPTDAARCRKRTHVRTAVPGPPRPTRCGPTTG